MSLNPMSNVLEDLEFAKADRQAGYKGRALENVIVDMELIVAEAEEQDVLIDAVVDCRQENKNLFRSSE
jgi:hypothetical protein